MATLAADLEQVHAQKPNRIQCTIARLMLTLDDEDRQALEQVMDTESITTRSIVDWLETHGHHVGPHSMRRHRKRSTAQGCRCPRASER